MKKLSKFSKILIVSISILLIVSTFVFASSRISILLNGKYVELNIEPEMINNRTMIPLRSVLEELGAVVTWDNVTKTATATTETHKIEISINSNVIKKTDLKSGDTEEIKIDQVAVVKNSRTLIPVRFVAEALGSKVLWDGDDKTVIILDYNKYKRDYSNKWKNLVEIMKYKYSEDKTLEANMSNEMEIVIKDSSIGQDIKVNLNFDMKSNLENSKAAEFEIIMNVDLDDTIKKQLELALERKLNLKDIKFKFYIDKEKVFASTNALRLLNLEDEMQETLEEDEITDFKVTDFYDGVYLYYKDVLDKDDIESKQICDAIDEIFSTEQQTVEDLEILVQEAFDDIEIADVEEAKYINVILELIPIMFSDEYLTITEDKVTYTFTKDDIQGLIEKVKNVIRPSLTNTEYAYLLEEDIDLENLKELEISASNNAKNKIYTDGNSKVIIKISYEDEYSEQSYIIGYNMNASFKTTEKKIYKSKFSTGKDIEAFVKDNMQGEY